MLRPGNIQVIRSQFGAEEPSGAFFFIRFGFLHDVRPKEITTYPLEELETISETVHYNCTTVHYKAELYT
jgi:hypothetical protein